MTENERLLELVKEGDDGARSTLIENNMGLVHSIARRFTGRGCDFEELCQIGAIGLIKATDRFSLDFGVQFSTYAVPVIMGEIKKFLRDDGPVKVARSLKELASRAMGEKERMENSLGREVTVSELSHSLGVEPEKLAMALSSAVTPRSLYEPGGEDDNEPVMDRIASEPSGEEKIVDRMALTEALSELDGRERSVIIMRYFRNMTQTDVSGLLGVSQVQVSRIESRAKKKLKKGLV